MASVRHGRQHDTPRPASGSRIATALLLIAMLLGALGFHGGAPAMAQAPTYSYASGDTTGGATIAGPGATYHGPSSDYPCQDNPPRGAPIIKKTAAVTGAYPSHEWWTSLFWQRCNQNVSDRYSSALWAYPLAAKAVAEGLRVSYPNDQEVTKGTGMFDDIVTYAYPFMEYDLTLGLAGLNAPDAKTDGYSDLSVTAAWDDGTNGMKATLARGVPFINITRTKGGAAPQISFNITEPSTQMRVWANNGSFLGVTICSMRGAACTAINPPIPIKERHYGLFAPAGSTWTQNGKTFTANLPAGQPYAAIAALPDATAGTLGAFQQRAFNFVTGGSAAWGYAANGQATTTLAYSTRNPISGATGGATYVGLLPTHWKAAYGVTAINTAYTYQSARGTLKVVDGTSFAYKAQRPAGILPAMPPVIPASDTAARDKLYALVDAEGQKADGALLPPNTATYATGKNLNRLDQIAQIADQLVALYPAGSAQATRLASVRDRLIGLVRARLEDWFTYSGASDPAFFFFDTKWGTMTGYPADFGADIELNDHHFHHAYFIMAAAVVARYSPASWVSQWGGIVDLLIKDVDNWDTADARFTRFRQFDFYIGHHYASGHANMDDGNNQESSSEAMNFNAAVALWGETSGNAAIRDLGAYLYATEGAAIYNYWYDGDGDIFPPPGVYQPRYSAMRWDGKATTAIWWGFPDWGPSPGEQMGINVLPVTGASFYLDKLPAAGVEANYQDWANRAASYNAPCTGCHWFEIMWQFRSFGTQQQAALDSYNETTLNTYNEAGESKTHTYHWLKSKNILGRVDQSYGSDSAFANAFNSAGTIRYVAYNPAATARTVTFTKAGQANCPITIQPKQILVTTTCGTTQPTPTSGSPTPTPPPATPTNTPTQPAGTNLALNKAASGSAACGSTEGPAKAVNGSVSGGNSDKFCTVTSPRSLQVDLGASATINSFTVRHAGAGGEATAWNTRDFSIQLSSDGVNWGGNVVNVTGNTASVTTHPIAATAARYVRLNITTPASDGNGAARIYEFEVYGTGGTNPTNTPTPTATATKTPTPTSGPPTATPTAPPGSNVLYVIDGATTTVQGALSLGAGGAAASDTIASVGGGNSDGTPTNPLVYRINGLTRTYDSTKTTQFGLAIDAQTAVGNGSQVRISYDFTGDGTWDRLETYNYFATDPVVGWERYTQASGLKSSSGAFANLSNGSVRVEIWNAIGNGTSLVRTSDPAAGASQSTVTIPFK